MTETEKIIQNTEKACTLCERTFTHKEIIDVIKKDNDIEKQICILKLDKILSQDEADLLVHHLTNHHGIIREAAAVKINELMKNETYSVFFQTEKISNAFLDAVIDMNPNICRLIIEILKYLNDKVTFFDKLYLKTIEVINDASTMNIRNKGYIYSKKVFKIFWYLEAVGELGYFINENKKELKILVEKSATFKDYTIREKTAKIISLLPKTIDFEIKDVESTLRNDENYFVRRFFDAPA